MTWTKCVLTTVSEGDDDDDAGVETVKAVRNCGSSEFKASSCALHEYCSSLYPENMSPGDEDNGRIVGTARNSPEVNEGLDLRLRRPPEFRLGLRQLARQPRDLELLPREVQIPGRNLFA